MRGRRRSGIVCRMSNDIPQAGDLFPIANQTRLGFLKNHITRPNIEVGDYTYYDDPAGMQEFERNVLYHFDFVGDRLIIGEVLLDRHGREIFDERRKPSRTG